MKRDLELLTDLSDIAEVAAEWRDLVPPGVGPFPGPDWAEIWWRHFGGSSDLWLLRSEDPRIFIPLECDGARVVRFVGGTELTDYAIPSCAEGDYDFAAESLAEFLAMRTDWKAASFEAIPGDSKFATILVEALVNRGMNAERESVEICALLNLPGDFDDYLATLSKKERHEFRRKHRRFSREIGEPALRPADDLDADLDLFVAWHRKAEGKKGSFMDPVMEGFFREMVHRMDELALLRFEFLEAGGERWAASLAFEDGERIYLYNSALRPEGRAHSPGMAMLYLLLERAVGAGVSCVDFLQGDERYKFHLGAKARPLDTVRVLP